MSLPFTHLHLHTEYSLLDGANKIELLAQRIKELGMHACAITDHGNMFGAIHFYKTMKKEGIKPIIGLEAYLFNGDDLSDKSTKERFHLCLFAKNEIGYKNLMYLSSQSYIHGFYYYPRLTKKLLRDHAEGLIATSACLQGEINWNLNVGRQRNRELGAGGYERAKELVREYQEIFGEDFYLEIMRHGISEQQQIDAQIIRLSKETGAKLIATNDTHYRLKEEAEAHELFMCISTNAKFDDPKRLRHSVHEFYIKSPEEMALIFADIPEALLNTQEIVDKCELDLKFGAPKPPGFKFTKERAREYGWQIDDDAEFFERLCRHKLEERIKRIKPADPKLYYDRLEREIKVIKQMGFPGYMLIVWDYINFARREGIPVGPGRGSAAGSLVAYALGITDIDPLPYNLLFERFLNPERVSMPDIDTDFCQDRREEVIDYVVRQYGRYNVAQVITFGSLLAKGVIRDVARVLDLPYAQADAIAKLIPEKLGITLDMAYEQEEKIRDLIAKDPMAARIWRFAKALEGLKRNAGMHAAGIVISNEELWHKAPLYKPSGEESIVCGYDGRFLEDVDLIKFDFLGLKTLTVIDNARKLVEAKTGEPIDLSTLDMNDPRVYQEIQQGHNIGLFQIESEGMQRLAVKLKPSSFEDIIAMLALYRPGPMESGMLDDFIERKHGRSPITYMFDALEPILAPTYGVIVYQEQVMQIVQTIGGFTLGQADIIRRAMGKKQVEYMQKQKALFAQGAAAQGLDPKKAEELFDLIEKFAGYGFNKSHSAAYGMVTFQTAWFKTYHPVEFMVALLTSEQDNTDKVVKYIDEAKRMGIRILPPSIFESDIPFTPVDFEGERAIRFGLGAIKGVGEAALTSILEARSEATFRDLSDFLSRIDSQKVNKKVLEALIKSGAMDGFGYSRKSLLLGIEKLVNAAQDMGRLKRDAMNSLFGDDEEIGVIAIELEQMTEYELVTILEMEKESLGFYVSGHPLDEYRAKILEAHATLSSDLEEVADGSDVILVGLIEDITTKISKRGKKLGIVKLLDLHGTIDLMLFEDQLKKLDEMDRTRPVAFKATVSKDEQFTRLSVRKIITLEDAMKEKVETKLIEKPEEPLLLHLMIDNDPKLLEELLRLVARYPGGRELVLVLKSKLADVQIESKIRVSSAIVEEIETLGSIEIGTAA